MVQYYILMEKFCTWQSISSGCLLSGKGGAARSIRALEEAIRGIQVCSMHVQGRGKLVQFARYFEIVSPISSSSRFSCAVSAS
jgi:hypothetical protein